MSPSRFSSSCEIQNNEIVSIVQFFLWKESARTNFILECLRVSTFGPFVASSFWHRFSCKLAGVWNWAQQMALERSSVHFSGMLSPPGQSLEHFLHKTHFQPSGARPISGVARRVGSVIQPDFFTSLWLGTLSTLFFDSPTTYNPVVYATKYALQSERDCIA